jgi:hypothetical protein
MIEPNATVELSVAGEKSLSGVYHVSSQGELTLGGMQPIPVANMSAKAAADTIAAALHIPQQSEINAAVRVESANIWAIFPVWAVGLLGGAVVNLVYPIYLLTKNKSWLVFVTNGRDLGLSVLIGAQFCLALVLIGKGMVLLGVLGASIGAGIQQAMQMVGGQGLGFLSGEWREVYGRPRIQMYLAIATLLVATLVMAYSHSLT